MNASQKNICKIILEMLTVKDFRERIRISGYYEIFKTTIYQYAEINNEYKKIRNNVKEWKEYYQFTKRAVDVINKHGMLPNEKLKKKLHFEHIVPVSFLTDQLVELQNLKLEGVYKIMEQNEVVILSKEEANVLDGSINEKKYLLDGLLVYGVGLKSSGTKEQRLNAISAILHKDYINNKINKQLL